MNNIWRKSESKGRKKPEEGGSEIKLEEKNENKDIERT